MITLLQQKELPPLATKNGGRQEKLKGFLGQVTRDMLPFFFGGGPKCIYLCMVI